MSQPANAPSPHEVDVLGSALKQIQGHLPPGWSTFPSSALPGPDLLLDLSAPDGTVTTLVIEARRSVEVRDLPRVAGQLETWARAVGGPAAALLAVRYIAPSVATWLEEHGVSYVDTTGNMRISIERPALYIRDRGADRDPWRGPGRPRGTLQGAPAARVVRALADYAQPVTMPELVRRSGASTGATYRVVEYLEREALLERTPRGPIIDVSWRAMLQRWSLAYGFQQTNSVTRFVQPRGLPALVERLAEAHGLLYAVTGSLAAHRLAPHAPARLAMIYVDDVDRAAELLDLRPVDTGANVLLAAPSYDVVFDRLSVVDGVFYAAPSQTAVDLLTGPGRSPAEGAAVLDWMASHETAWRR
ncbi:helix-turn-helix domain-containing protein [Phytohabitans sp. LJ34]|uniref:helix-turn-helix domain-containing protein n=1 Tax=Phytohabitans sp. LJ34 TaxID=3452217 RepID=UPI003F898BF0